MSYGPPMVVDLRSDTVTRPTAEMRRAMADADVGDDVFGEDPSVNRLQQRAAEVLGKEAALYVPSGTMANQIAIAVHTRPGDELLVGRNAHNWLFESGAAAAISGVQPCQLPGDGRYTGDDLRAAYKQEDHHHPPTRMVSVENTHNMGGGLVWDRDDLAGVLAAADDLGLAKHLDGARLWNAAAATGATEAELSEGFDTVAVCLSKGLGAPVGSLLAGSTDLIHEAHRVRARLGGAMRQAGIIAAAGLHAIDHHRARLADDHANAAFLAEAIDELPGLSVDRAGVHTNIVMVDTDGDAATLMDVCSRHEVLFFDVAPRRVRLVTHLGVDRAGCERAVEVLREVVSG